MNRAGQMVVGTLMLVALVPGAALGATYSSYYDCTPGRTTAIVVTNASDFATEAAYVLRVYDPDGQLLAEVSGGLAEYESTVLFLNEIIDEPGELSWGLAQIESSLLLQVATWIGELDKWVAVVNTTRFPLSTEDLGIAQQWYSINYASTGPRSTAITLINPNDEPVSGALYIFDATGAALDASGFTIEPHQLIYFLPEATYESSDKLWGLIDVRATRPILLVGEYFDEDTSLVDVEVIDSPYYLQNEAEG
ncbi:hypothetical protein KJ567_01745, partial [Candidatus Bipolaricaulota bacterium]|nr:hypothetical protein [Candidatus Bipolaricaulota bacterium]